MPFEGCIFFISTTTKLLEQNSRPAARGSRAAGPPARVRRNDLFQEIIEAAATTEPIPPPQAPLLHW